jgi:hypothetical protein
MFVRGSLRHPTFEPAMFLLDDERKERTMVFKNQQVGLQMILTEFGTHGNCGERILQTGLKWC